VIGKTHIEFLLLARGRSRVCGEFLFAEATPFDRSEAGVGSVPGGGEQTLGIEARAEFAQPRRRIAVAGPRPILPR
jgi:hypothetical protein